MFLYQLLLYIFLFTDFIMTISKSVVFIPVYDTWKVINIIIIIITHTHITDPSSAQVRMNVEFIRERAELHYAIKSKQ
jgi:hypothetical protein